MGTWENSAVAGGVIRVADDSNVLIIALMVDEDVFDDGDIPPEVGITVKEGVLDDGDIPPEVDITGEGVLDDDITLEVDVSEDSLDEGDAADDDGVSDVTFKGDITVEKSFDEGDVPEVVDTDGDG